MSDTIRCRHRLPSPEVAGFCDVVNPETGEVVISAGDALKDAAARSPHMRPCPRCKGSQGTWNWTERRYCERCPDAVGVHA